MANEIRRLYLSAIALVITAQAQSQPSLTFEAASVRAAGREPPSRPMPARGDILGGPGTEDPSRITYTWVTMASLLVGAFGFGSERILSEPDWVDNERFDLRAIVPVGATKEQVQQMMQNLLKERFHLAFHRGEKEFTACALVVAKGGSKLKEAAPADGALPPHQRGTPAVLDRDGFPILPPGYTEGQTVPSDPPGVMRMTYRSGSVGVVRALLDFLGGLECINITDKTGLTSKYDFRLEYARGIARAADQAGIASDPAPDLVAAVEKQLGLSVVKSAVKLDIVVIDHLDRQPTEN